MAPSCKSTGQYLECCLYFTSNTFSRLINKMSEEVFMPTGLAPSYAFLMMVVVEKGSISIGELANTLNLAPSTLTRFVDALIAKEYLERKQEGRNMVVTPTQMGKELLPSIQKAWKSLYKRYSEVLGEAFAKQLTADLVKANAILGGK